MAEISVLICTLNDRIMQVPRVLLPEREAVHYVVSFQYTNDIFLDMVPDELRQRRDVTLLSLTESGLCLNRNNALRACPTPYAVISDDDTHYTSAMLDEITETFSNDDELDIIVFGDNRLAFRITQHTPQFDTRFGLGSEYLSCGEEEVMLHQARTYGMKVLRREFNDYRNPRSPWDQMAFDKRVRRSWGALQYMQHSSAGALFRVVSKSLTLHLPNDKTRPIATRWQCFRDIFDGFRYIVAHPLNGAVAEDIPLDFQPIDIWRMP